MTKPLGPHGNPSIIDDSLHHLRIHARLMIHPLQNQRAMWGRQGSVAAGGGKRRWDGSPVPPRESPKTGDGAAMEEALHNASQVQAHIG